jgi:GH18 family chitinase
MLPHMLFAFLKIQSSGEYPQMVVIAVQAFCRTAEARLVLLAIRLEERRSNHRKLKY